MYAPSMSPDGKLVVFAATVEAVPGGSMLEPLAWLGLQAAVARAHDVPWELFIVPSSGGTPSRITTMQEDQPHPAWIDNDTIAFLGETGLYHLRIDGTGRPDGEPQRIHAGAEHAALTWHGSVP
jgi:hypothetical protein